MSDFGTRFGELVYRKREERGWGLGQLAIAAYGDDGKGGESRKPDVNKIEQGKSRKPNAATIRKYRLALDLTQEEIDACRTPQEIQLAQFANQLFQVIAQAAEALDLTEDYALAVSERYAEGNPGDFEGALNGIKAAMEEAAKDRARGSNLPDIDGILAEVKALDDAGEIDEADAALEAAIAKRREERERQKAEDTRLLERAIRQAVTTRNAESFADRSLELVKLEAPSAEDQFKQLLAQQNERFEAGRRFGTRFALDAAIGLARKCADIAPAHQLWAASQNNLGNALQEQGTRTGGEDGTRLLAEAITACRDALAVYKHDDHPVEWAMTQNNLAIALRNQGTRTGGEDGTRLLAEAITACRDALAVYKHNDHPVEWAMTQNNLGAALQEQGTRTGGEDGTRLLAEAVTAYRDALTVRTREDHPLQWAMTQNNLAIALRNQGTRTGGEDGTRLLAAAVSAYRDALTVRTREDHPVPWAMTQNNLGIALKDQGIRTGGEDGTRLLAEAVTAYRDALTVRTRDDQPVDWALTQENLAIAEQAIAEHDGTKNRRPHLDAALAHVDAALTVYDPEHMPYDHGTATRLRDLILKALGKAKP